jgi:repressor LexA
MEQIKLTARQQQILTLIQTALQNTGAPPTRAEIAAELGFKSANAAEEHLQALARKGVIQLVSGTSRGIRLKNTGSEFNTPSGFKQFQLPLQALAQLTLPLVGRVAAGSPILAGALFTAGGLSLFSVSAIMACGSVMAAALMLMLALREAD